MRTTTDRVGMDVYQGGPLLLQVIVPLASAIVSGMMAGLLLAFVLRALTGVWDSWETVGITVLTVAIFSWAQSRADYRTLLLWPIEQATGTDLDGDGHIGDPGGYVLINPPQETVDPREQRRRAIVEFVRGCETRTDMRYWESRGMSRDSYVEFRDLLIRSHWAAWNVPGSEKQGWALRFPASEIVAKIA